MAARGAGTDRTYGQWCPVAVGLDILGDRWVLLICRELLMGDRRFTDLRDALPGLAPNLLTERLRSLQTAGLVETAELPPPAARTVYRLTEQGHSVTPVLRALARFGVSHLDGDPSPTFDARRALHSLVLPWRQRTEADLRVRLVLRGTGANADDSADLVLRGTSSEVTRPAGDADVTITTDAASLARARKNESAGLDAVVTGSLNSRRLALQVLGFQLTRQ